MYKLIHGSSAVLRLADGAVIPDDERNLDRVAYLEWLQFNTPEAADELPAPTAERVISGFTEAIQKRLDVFAQTRNYDGILSACTYADDPNPKFAAEGRRCVDLRSATWARAYELLAEVQDGVRLMPQRIEDIEAELPELKWPDLGDGK